MGFFEKLGEGLRKTRDSIFGSIAGLVNAGEITDELYDDLEEQLILADTGADVAMRLVEELRQEVRRKRHFPCRCRRAAVRLGRTRGRACREAQ